MSGRRLHREDIAEKGIEGITSEIEGITNDWECDGYQRRDDGSDECF